MMNKQIEEMAKVLCEDCARDTSPCVLTKTARMCDSVKEQAEALYNAGYRKQNEWISVEDMLPDWSDGKVLVFTEYGFSICERTVNGRWKGKHGNWITHWMPLPEAPKGE